jgi:hypothetical protein
VYFVVCDHYLLPVISFFHVSYHGVTFLGVYKSPASVPRELRNTALWFGGYWCQKSTLCMGKKSGALLGSWASALRALSSISGMLAGSDAEISSHVVGTGRALRLAQPRRRLEYCLLRASLLSTVSYGVYSSVALFLAARPNQ